MIRRRYLGWFLGMFLVVTTALPVLAENQDNSQGQDDSHGQNRYLQTNLVSDGFVSAANTDAKLINPWGMASSSTSPLWVADNGQGVATVYNGTGATAHAPVTIPPPSTMPGATSAPTGTVFNSTTDFSVGGTPAHFIFATEDGTIAAWASGSSATLEVDNLNTSTGPVYKGLALGSSAGTNLLYAANFRDARVDVFGPTFAPFTTLPGHFVDTGIPSGYAPFGIQLLDGKLYVTYALQDSAKHDDVAGHGHGFVDVFNTDGTLVHRFASRGDLNSPWGLAIAPSGFGRFSGDVLVGNFGDGRINAFSRDSNSSGDFEGQLEGDHDRPIVIGDLWGLRVGNGGSGGDVNKVYFTAGVKDEAHGLFGSLEASPRRQGNEHHSAGDDRQDH